MPTRYELPQDDERTALREGVVRALHAVPMHFVSTIKSIAEEYEKAKKEAVRFICDEYAFRWCYRKPDS